MDKAAPDVTTLMSRTAHNKIGMPIAVRFLPRYHLVADARNMNSNTSFIRVRLTVWYLWNGEGEGRDGIDRHPIGAREVEEAGNRRVDCKQ